MSYLILPPAPVGPNGLAHLAPKGNPKPCCTCTCPQNDPGVLNENNRCCNCTCHHNNNYNPSSVPLQHESTVQEDDGFTEVDLDGSDQGEEEERMDMFEWMARQRLNEVHKKKELITHEYASREPLKPEVVHDHVQRPPAQTSESRNYLKAVQIVQNMKAKWEAMTKEKNAPPPPLERRRVGGAFVKPGDLFKGILPRVEGGNDHSHTVDHVTHPHEHHKELHQDHDAQIVNHLIKRPVEELPRPLAASPSPQETTRVTRQMDKMSQVDISELEGPRIPEQIVILETPERVHAEAQTTPRLCHETTENGVTSLKCTRHVITKPEVLMAEESREEFQKVVLKKPQHRNSLDVDPRIRKSLLPLRLRHADAAESVEGLIPITSFEAQVPPLPHPIVDTSEEEASSSCSCSDDDEIKVEEKEPHWYSGWFSKKDVNTTVEEDDGRKSIIEHAMDQVPTVTTHEEEFDIVTASEDTGSESLTASSIALEIHGHVPRRATITEDEFLLLDLSADFDETVLEEFDPKVSPVHKSKSRMNVTPEEFHQVAKSLSEERIRKGTNVRSDMDLKYHERDFHICHKCQKIVRAGDAMFQFQNGRQTVWHRECFVCTTCGKQLGLMDHLFYEEEPYCYEDYVMIAHVPRCHGCGGWIFDSSYTSAAGHFWHKEHFVCWKCKRPLVDTKYVVVEGNPYCFSCHQKDFKKVCKSCGKTIQPHESYVQSGDYFWHSNDSCLHCQTCGRSLVGRSVFFRKAGHLYCNRYCALGRAPT